MGVLLHPLLLLGVYCIFSIFCTPVAGIDPDTEKFLTGLTKSKISSFATTSSTVNHMETDKYKPGYVVYTDGNALITSDGNTTKTITGGQGGYQEGRGENARFNSIRGFTQLSSTTIIVSDSSNHCLRLVDRVTRVTSVFAGQCKSQGYQDGSSAKFYYPKAVIVDMRSSKQLLVTDEGSRAVRTVDVESKSVGTFIKSDQLSSISDMVQHLVTGDIYIARSGLIKVDYVTKSVERLSVYSSIGGLSVLDATTLILTEPNENSVSIYDTDSHTQFRLNICRYPDVPEYGRRCDEVHKPKNVLRTNRSIFIEMNREIIQVEPSLSQTVVTKNLTGETTEKPTVCRDRNITVYTNNITRLATVKIIDGYDVSFEPGNHAFRTPGGFLNETCTIRVQVIDNSTVSSAPDLQCPDELISLTSPESDLATFRLMFGDQEHSLMLPLGHYPYTIKSGENICNVTMIAEDYRVRRTLEFVADYLVDCAVINSTVIFSLLSDVAQQQFPIIDTLCDSACKGRAANAKPFITCKDSNRLRIRWPTDRVFPADVTRVPDDLRVNLESRIRNKGLTFNVVVFGASPPVVYPQKADNGGYASLLLTSSCIDGWSFSDAEQKCI